MSRDTKTDGYTNRRRGHPETSDVSFSVSPVLFETMQDESSETDDREAPLRPVTSFAATSETDEGDYETSSEGPIPSKLSGTDVHGASKESLCGYSEEKSTSLSKLCALDSRRSSIKREVIPDPQLELVENRLTRRIVCAHTLVSVSKKSLAKSKSLPIFKHCEASSDASVNLKATDDALMSESSIARKKKMSTIIKRMFMLPYLSMVSVTTGSTANFQGDQYDTRTLEKKMTLSVLRDATPTVINDERSEELLARVTLHETRSNHRAATNRDSHQNTTPIPVNDEAVANLTNEDESTNVTKNTYSSIKSVYLSPNPPSVPDDLQKAKPGKGRRMSTDVNALLRLDHELGPLRCQLNEIVGKARALGLNGPYLDLDVYHPSDQRLDLSDRSTLSLSASGDFPDLGQTSRPATTSYSLVNRSGLVGKTTSPSSTFSVVDKPVPGESRTNWLNENGSNRQRQEALSLAFGDPTRALERFCSLVRSSGQLGNSASHLPSDAIRASRRESLLSGVFGERPRDGRASNETFQLRCKSFSTIERDMLAWKAWSAHSRVHVSRPSLLHETERGSRDYLYRGVGNLRVSNGDDCPELRRQRSPVSGGYCLAQLLRSTSRTSRSNYTSRSTTVQVIDGNWSSQLGREPVSQRSVGHSGVLGVHARNSVATQAGFAIGDHKGTQTEAERVDSRISKSINLRRIDRGVGSANQIPRAVSAAVSCAPRIRVVSVNTEFRATVGKRYTGGTVSPIRNCPAKCAEVVSSSSSDVLLAASVSGVLVQQVRELPEAARSPAVLNEKNDMASPGRDPRPRKFALEDGSSKVCESEEVFTDGIPESPREAPYPNFPISKRTDESRSRLSHQVVPIQTRSGKARSPPKEANETSPGDVSESHASICLIEEEPSNGKLQKAREIYVSRVSRSGLCARRVKRGPSATSVVLRDPRRPTQARISRSTRLGRKAREYCRANGPGIVVRGIPGMRSSPEDFFCDT